METVLMDPKEMCNTDMHSLMSKKKSYFEFLLVFLFMMHLVSPLNNHSAKSKHNLVAILLLYSTIPSFIYLLFPW
jgi:hypothetical protein